MIDWSKPLPKESSQEIDWSKPIPSQEEQPSGRLNIHVPLQVHKNPPPEQQMGRQGWPGVAEDVGQLIYNAPIDALNMLTGLPEQAYEGAKQALGGPLPGHLNPRTSMNFLSGLLEHVGKAAYNVPGKTAEYLGQKGIIPEEYIQRGQEAQMGDTGLQQRFLGEEQPGDVFWQSLAPFVAFKRPISAGAATSYPTVAALTAAQGGNPFAASLLQKGGEVVGKGVGKAVGEVRDFNAEKEAVEKLKKSEPNLRQAVEEAEKQYNEAQKRGTDFETKISQAEGKATESELKIGEAERKISEVESRVGEAESDLSQVTKQAEEAKKIHDQQIEEATQKQQQAQMEHYGTQIDTGADTAKTLHRRINQTQEKIHELNKEMAETPDVSHLPKAERLFEESAKTLNETEKEINKTLGESLTHNERIAEAIYEPQIKIQDEIASEYNKINKDSEPYQVPIAENKELAQLEKDLRKAMPNATTKEFQKVLEEAARQWDIDTKTQSVNAEQYLQKWRSVRNAGYDMIDQAKDMGNTAEAQQMRVTGEEALRTASQMLETYRENVPPEIYERLIKNNERFKKEVVPVRYNNVWKEIDRKRKISGKDMVEKLQGQQPGQAILRQHVLNNPIASELMLGSRLAGKEGEWHGAKGIGQESAKPYFEATRPKTKELFETHKQAKESLTEAGETVKKLSPIRQKKMQLQQDFEVEMNKLERDKQNLDRLKASEQKVSESKKRVSELKSKTPQTEVEAKKKIVEQRKKEVQEPKREAQSYKREAQKYKREVQQHKREAQHQKMEEREFEERKQQTLKEKMEHEKEIKELEDSINERKNKLYKIALAIGTGSSFITLLKGLF